MMALFVASHYKNSPNDLQLMADAPAHHLFVLLGPVDESKNHLPDILCVIQICFEGNISQESAMKSLTDGHQPFGDQIAWKFCEQFRDAVFPTLSVARIVRIATHPSAVRLGYGSAAVELLARYFEGQLAPMSEFDCEEIPESAQVRVIEVAEKVSLLDEIIKPRSDVSSLLVPLRERRPEELHYLGVSFGLTRDLFSFWRKNKFVPFYIGHVPSEVTGENTCMVLKPMNNNNIESIGSDQFGYLSTLHQEFKNRFRENLAQDFNQMEYKLCMSILDPKLNFSEIDLTLLSSSESLSLFNGMQSFSMELLEAYKKNLVDYHMTSHLVGALAHSYFCEKIPVTLSPLQASVLLCMGLQLKKIHFIKEEMELPGWQILSLYMKVMTKFYDYLSSIASKDTHSTASRLKDVSMEPHCISVDEDLENAAKQVQDKMQVSLNGFIGSCGSMQQQKKQKENRKNERERHKRGSYSKTNKRRKS